MTKTLCKLCDAELIELAVVPRDPQLEGAGPDLSWGCLECNARYDVFLADDPHKDDDFVAVIHDGYNPEQIPE